MQVACPSCAAEYALDERRLPASGLKMRCPKCASRFHVQPDGSVDAAAAAPTQTPPSFPRPADLPRPAAASIPKPAVPKPEAPRSDAGRFDDYDDLPAVKGAFSTPAALDFDGLDLPVASPSKPRPGASTAARVPPVARGPGPTHRPISPREKAKIAPPLPAAAPSLGELDLDLDLPAPKPASPRPSPMDLDLDLPMAKPARPRIAPPMPSRATPAEAMASKATPTGGMVASRDEPLTLDETDLPAAKRRPPTSPKPPSPEPVDLDLDLPAPRSASRSAPLGNELDLDSDLPAARRPRAPAAASSLDDDFDLDLPAPRTASGRAGLDRDLPAPATPMRAALADDSRTPFDDLDLPAPKGALDMDLPQARARSVIEQADEAFGDLDLPMPMGATSGSGFGDLDLPMPKSEFDLPAAKGGGFGNLDLPTPISDAPGLHGAAYGDLDLPTPRDGADLPALHGGMDLPVARSDGLDLPAPHGAHDLPVAKHASEDPFDELALPSPRSLGSSAGYAEPAETRDAAGRAGLGGVGFGELDLGEVPAGDDMEFADIPQEGADAAGQVRDSLPPPRVVAKKKKAPAAAGAPKKSKLIWMVAAGLAVLLIGGGALALTPYGAFGIYFFDRFLPGAGDPAQVRAAITAAEAQAQSDRWVDVRASLVTLGTARRTAGLNRELLARSLVHEGLYQARFRADASAAHASAIRARLDERGADGPELALGRAADALRQGDLAVARAALGQARVHAGDDPYVDLVAGEIELADGALDEARAAFARAAEGGAGARGLYGVARALIAGGDAEAARAAVDAVLEASPHHGEAMVARAQMHLDAGEVDEALALARAATGGVRSDAAADPGSGRPSSAGRTAPRARARGWALIGRVQETRGRRTLALEAYEAALVASDSHVPALLGAGRVLLADRPADALARFESVLLTEGEGAVRLANGRTERQEAQLGAARAMLALGRAPEAHRTMESLTAELDADAEVLLWAGNAEQELDPPNREAAEQHYRAAILGAPDGFPAYLALAELFLTTDRDADAGAVLRQAAARVPESAEMRAQLGAFELRRHRLPQAIHELERALALDEDLPSALFSLGVAQRRSGQLEQAAQVFERLAVADSGHPGLALERGLLFEARGESARAVQSYRAALEEQPEDMDLLLRLGAAQVAAGQVDDAEDTLARVQLARPNSPEAHHFVGRVAFARGRFAEALSSFRQAARLDPSRGEYHLFVGWAALENGQLGEALNAEDAAIEHDESLGDAYWIRGIVKFRQGLPEPALADLLRARTLAPSRTEIHAGLGDVYDELRRLGDAIAAYETAVERVDDNGHWWYRLGRLRMDRGARGPAAEALARATLLGEAMASRPGWLADAHRLQADAARLNNQRAEAVEHYRRYLEIAPAGAIDRDDVRHTLMDLGEVPPRE